MTKIYTIAKSETKTITVLEFLGDIEPVLGLDKSFQASEDSRWNEDEKSSYITSLITGMAPSKFIFCDVEKCLKHAKETESKSDVEYFKYWLDRGVKYLNLDSNNRATNIKAFINNQVSIEEGLYSLGDRPISIEMKTFYKDLNKSMKYSYADAKIDMTIYTNVSREQLSDLFSRINDGKPLNDEEKRNASTSNIAKVIRDLASQYKGFFASSNAKWFDNKEIIRRKIDGFIAGLALIFYEGLEKGMMAREFNKMYRIDSNASRTSHKFKKIFNDFMKFVTKDLYAIPKKNAVLDLFVLYMQMREDGKQLSRKYTKSQFIKEYVKVVSDMIGSDKLIENKYRSLKEPQTFTTMLSGRVNGNNQMRNELLKKTKKLDKFFIQLDKKRVASDTDKLVVANEQNWDTPEGKEIEMSRLQTGDFEKGHIENYRDGGESTRENLVIQTSEDNKKLGSSDLTKH